MEEPAEIPRPRSAARTWLQILTWTIPGFSSPALLAGAFMTTYANPGWDTYTAIAFWVILVIIILGCAVFDNLLQLPKRAPDGAPDDPERRFRMGRFSFFIVMQAVLTPLIGFATASACNAIL